MDLAIALGGRERQEVLRVELVGYTGKCSPQVLPEPDLRETPAGLFGDLGKTGIGEVL